MGNCQLKGALYRAVGCGDVPLTRSLLVRLGSDADLSFRQAPGGTTLLHVACIVGHTDIVRLLLDWPDDVVDGAKHSGTGEASLAGRDLVNLVDVEGRTALYIASMGGHLGCVELLLKAGASVNIASTEGGRTPLFVSCWRGRSEVARLLLEHGGDLARRDQEGKACWQIAKEWNHLDLAHEMEALAQQRGQVVPVSSTPPSADQHAVQAEALVLDIRPDAAE